MQKSNRNQIEIKQTCKKSNGNQIEIKQKSYRNQIDMYESNIIKYESIKNKKTKKNVNSQNQTEIK